MARIRSIKPELAADRTLAALPIPVRYTFLLCVSQADDYGLLLAEPRQLLGQLYPHDESVNPEMLSGWLERLVEAGRLRWRRTLDGARVLEIVNWGKHQSVKNPGKPLLLDRLEPLDPDQPETLTPSSVEPPAKRRRNVGDLGGAEREREREREQGKGIITAGAVGGWPAEASAIYAEHIGLRSPAEIGKVLKPAVATHGWETLRPWWEAYCRAAPYRKRDGSIHGDRGGDRPEDAVKDTRFCSPRDFLNTLATWRERCQPLKLA